MKLKVSVSQSTIYKSNNNTIIGQQQMVFTHVFFMPLRVIKVYTHLFCFIFSFVTKDSILIYRNIENLSLEVSNTREKNRNVLKKLRDF